MRKLLLPAIILLLCLQPFMLKSQTVNDPEFLKSIQGTWVFADKDAPFWYKVIINGNTLQVFEAEPGEGKFSTNTTVEILKSVKTTFRGGSDGESNSRSYAQIGAKNLNFNEITLENINGRTTLVCKKFKKEKYQTYVVAANVPPDFNPWK